MAAAGRADSWGREEGTRGGESWRYEEGENPDLLLAENPTRDGPNGHGLMRPSSGQRFAAAVGHDSSAAARHEGGGGREARGGEARIERVWPVVVRVAASAECRRLVCEVAGVCVREALRTGWSCLVGCGEEEGSDGARDSKGEDLNGGVVQRGAAGREKRVRGGGRMLQGLTAGARMVQWTVACSRGGLRRGMGDRGLGCRRCRQRVRGGACRTRADAVCDVAAVSPRHCQHRPAPGDLSSPRAARGLGTQPCNKPDTRGWPRRGGAGWGRCGRGAVGERQGHAGCGMGCVWVSLPLKR